MIQILSTSQWLHQTSNHTHNEKKTNWFHQTPNTIKPQRLHLSLSIVLPNFFINLQI